MPSPVSPHVPLPDSETHRLEAVRHSGIRDTAPEAVLDGLVELAARICGTSSAEINLVDADDLWFCAARGMGTPGATVARELTFCTWTVLDRDRPLLVADAADDPRFSQNPFVVDGTIRSYAGYPLLAEGEAIGTLCVHDPAPRALDADQLHALSVLAAAAQAQLALRRHVDELGALVRTDALTGAANRRAIDETLERELAQADRRAAPLSFLLLDLDHFKAYNDAHGHQAGDLLLQRAARAWRGALRAGDLLGRWGGEEFCVVLPDCTPERAHDVAERLRELVPDDVSCSIGIAGSAPGETATQLVARADAALYSAKGAGRDRVVAAVPATGISRAAARAAS